MHDMFYNCTSMICVDISSILVGYDVFLFNSLPLYGTITIHKKSKNKINYIPLNWNITYI